MRTSLRFRWHMLLHDFAQWRERVLIWIVWQLPRAVVYWSAIRVIANATAGAHSDQIVPDLTAMDALKRWKTPS